MTNHLKSILRELPAGASRVALSILLCSQPALAWGQSGGSANPPVPPSSSSTGAPAPTICGATCSGTNQAPNVQLTSPVNGSTANAPATVVLAASVSDDGMIDFVQFYSNGVEIGADASYPYSMSYPGLMPGSYSFTAMATDDEGASGVSTAKVVTVNIPPNNAPTVVLTAPVNGAAATAPGTFLLMATASDGDGTVTKVEFKSGTTLLCTDTTSPYSCAYTSRPAGSYALKAIATDNWGATGNSATATVTVSGTMPAPVSETRTYVYDEYERLCKTINPESGASVVEYDAAGNILWTADGTTLTGSTCNRSSVRNVSGM